MPTASEFYAAKLARFQTTQARSKERKLARQYAQALKYNRRWQRRNKLRLKRELRGLLREARRIASR